MPTVPQYGVPTVQQRPVSQERMSPAGASAGARQEQQFGQALQRVGSDLGDVALKMQERANVDAVFRAETELKTAETEFHNGVRDRQLENAKGATQDANKFWQERSRKIRGNLENDAQRRAFDQIAQERRTASMDFVSRHEALEGRRAATAAAEASAEASKQAGVANPATADVNAQSIERTYRAIGQVNGTPKEVIDAQIQEKVTEMHAAVVGGLIDKHPERARAYLNEYGDDMTPTVREKLKEQLRAGEVKGFAQRKADEIMAKYPDDDRKQLEEARKIQTPEKREALVAQIKARQNERETIEKREKADARDAAYRAITEGNRPGGTANPIRTIYDLPVEIYNALDEGDKAALAKELSGSTVKTDYGTYYQLREFARVNPQGFAAMDLTQYFPALDNTKRTEMIKLREDILAGKTDVADIATVGQQLSAAHNALNWGNDNREEKGRFDSQVYETIAAQERIEKRKLNYDERQQIIDRMMIEGEVVKPGFRLFDPDAQFFEVEGTSDEAYFVPDIPEDFRKAATNVLLGLGREVTEEEILRMYRKHTGLKNE